MAITLRQLNQGQEDEYEDDLSYSSLGGLTPEEAILQAQYPFAQQRRGGYRRPVDRGPLFNLGGVNQQGYRAERLDPAQRRMTGQLGMVDGRGQPLRQRPPQLQQVDQRRPADMNASPLMRLFMQWQRQLQNEEQRDMMERMRQGNRLLSPQERRQLGMSPEDTVTRSPSGALRRY